MQGNSGENSRTVQKNQEIRALTAAIKCVISPGVLKSETLTRTVPVSRVPALR